MSDERTRVVFVINDLRRAGAETQLVRLATGVDRARFRPSVVILKTQVDFESELRDAGVAVTALGRRSPWDVLVLRRLERALRAVRPQIVHSFLPFANLLTSIAARRARVPVVILSQRASYEATLSPAWRRAARWSHRRASHVIVNSEAARREELAAGFPGERISYVPNGVALPAAPAAVERADLGLPDGELVVCVAQFASEKGHADLLAAWPRVREASRATLALVGDGALRSEVEALAASLRVSDSVRFLGFRHPTAPYLAAADVVVLPSRTEGMPNAVLEAMALGKAVVATSVGGVPELLEHGVSGSLVPPGDPAALAGALLTLLAEPELARRLGAAAQARALSLFAAPRMVEATERVYRAASSSYSVR
jgi:glycosyltransferase involved in cell wall biosynthesis